MSAQLELELEELKQKLKFVNAYNAAMMNMMREGVHTLEEALECTDYDRTRVGARRVLRDWSGWLNRRIPDAEEIQTAVARACV